MHRPTEELVVDGLDNINNKIILCGKCLIINQLSYKGNRNIADYWALHTPSWQSAKLVSTGTNLPFMYEVAAVLVYAVFFLQCFCFNFTAGLIFIMKNGVFWEVTPCGSCKNRRFGGTWRLLHQGDKNW
jgi:hypothetical protein